jgi:hypothetical protein
MTSLLKMVFVNSSCCTFLSVTPAKEWVKISQLLVIPARGRSPRARKPGAQACGIFGMAGVHGFRAWPCGPSRNDERVRACERHFLTGSFRGGADYSRSRNLANPE